MDYKTADEKLPRNYALTNGGSESPGILNQPNDKMSDEELEALAPWNESVKAEIAQRANEANQQ